MLSRLSKKLRSKPGLKVLYKEVHAQRGFQRELQLQQLALEGLGGGVSGAEELELVVSLTSFGGRVEHLHLTIESLLQQSLRPDAIVLWLSAEEFSFEQLPELLKRQCDRGLSIRFCERDLGPHTKYFYALKAFPKARIITVDDDILYPVDLVDQLVRASERAPDIIHCQRAHKILADTEGGPLPYKRWEKDSSEREAALDIFPTGVGGVLYFPGCFDDAVNDMDLLQRLAPTADDVWLKAMSLKAGVRCQVVPDVRSWGSRFFVVSGSQAVSLKRRNKRADCGNDVQIKKSFDHFGLKL